MLVKSCNELFGFESEAIVKQHRRIIDRYVQSDVRVRVQFDEMVEHARGNFGVFPSSSDSEVCDVCLLRRAHDSDADNEPLVYCNYCATLGEVV